MVHKYFDFWHMCVCYFSGNRYNQVFDSEEAKQEVICVIGQRKKRLKCGNKYTNTKLNSSMEETRYEKMVR